MPPGFEQGAGFIGKSSVLPTTSGGWSKWAGKSVVIEAQAHAYVAMSRMDDNYLDALAKHHHDGRLLSEGCTAFIAGKYVAHSATTLQRYDLYLPGAKNSPAGLVPPSSVEYMLENPYAPKRGTARQRLIEKEEKWRANPTNPKAGVVWPDCVMRRAGITLRERGAKVAVPESEADGSLAAAALLGRSVIVGSNDSDIVMYPLGRGPWEIHFPARAKAELLTFTPDVKAKAMSENFGVGLAVVNDNFDRAELLYLCAAALTSQDYHGRINAEGKFTSKTGIGGESWPPLFRIVGELVAGAKPSWAEYSTVADTAYALLLAQKGRIDAATGEKKATALGKVTPPLLERCKAVVRGFLDQLVSPGPGKKCCPYWELRRGPTLDLGPAIRTLEQYCYVGKCGECPLVGEESFELSDNDVEMVAVGDVGGGGGKSVKLLLRDVVDLVHGYSEQVDWGGSDRSPFDKVCENFGRAAACDPEFKVGIVDPDDPQSAWPPGVGKTANGKGLIMFVFEFKAIQSYGAGAYAKEGHRENEFYIVNLGALANKDDGQYVRCKMSGGLADTGFVAIQCFCKSPFKLCNHALAGMICLSKVREADLFSSTHLTAYWRVAAGVTRKAGKDGRLLKPWECMTHKLYLNEIVGVYPEALTLEEAEQMLVSPPDEIGEETASDRKKVVKALMMAGKINRQRRSAKQASRDTHVELRRKFLEMHVKAGGFNWGVIRDKGKGVAAKLGFPIRFDRPADDGAAYKGWGQQ